MPEETQEVVETPEVEENPVEDNVEAVEGLVEGGETEEPTEEDALANAKNPERTKKYIEKLKEEKKQYKNVLDSLVPAETPAVPAYQVPVPQAQEFKNLPQETIKDTYQAMIDENGYIDGNKLLATLEELDRNSKQAIQTAQRVAEHAQRVQAAQEEAIKSEAVRKAHSDFPMLDPDHADFNPRFYDLVRNDLIGQMMEGRQDIEEAAQRVYDDLYGGQVTKAEKEAKELKETQKAQINAVKPRPASTADQYDANEEADLIKRMRQGKKGAVGEALRRRGL